MPYFVNHVAICSRSLVCQHAQRDCLECETQSTWGGGGGGNVVTPLGTLSVVSVYLEIRPYIK